MNRIWDLGLWLAAALMFGAGALLSASPAAPGLAGDTLWLMSAAAFAAVAAQFGVGLTRRPILALSIPLLAGWWVASALPLPLIWSFPIAAAAGAGAGALTGAVSSVHAGRCAALTLAMALAADIVSDLLAAAEVASLAPMVTNGGTAPAPSGVALAVIAGVTLAAGWWSQTSLAASLMHHGSDARAAAALGVRMRPLVGLATTLGGVAGGLAGASMATAATAPPDVTTGLVLAAAAYAGGATMAGTLALVAAFWLLPELVQPGGQALKLSLAALACLMVVATCSKPSELRETDA